MQEHYLTIEIKVEADSESDATNWIYEILDNQCQFKITSHEWESRENAKK